MRSQRNHIPVVDKKVTKSKLFIKDMNVMTHLDRKTEAKEKNLDIEGRKIKCTSIDESSSKSITTSSSRDEHNYNYLDDDKTIINESPDQFSFKTNQFVRKCEEPFYNATEIFNFKNLLIEFMYGISYVTNANMTSSKTFIPVFEGQMLDVGGDELCKYDQVISLSSSPLDIILDDMCSNRLKEDIQNNSCAVVHGKMTLNYTDGSGLDFSQNLVNVLRNSTDNFVHFDENGDDELARIIFMESHGSNSDKSSWTQFLNIKLDDEIFIWGIVVFVGLISILSACCCCFIYKRKVKRKRADKNKSSSDSNMLPFFH